MPVIARTTPRESYNFDGAMFYVEWRVRKLDQVGMAEVIERYAMREIYTNPWVLERRAVHDKIGGGKIEHEWTVMDCAASGAKAARHLSHASEYTLAESLHKWHSEAVAWEKEVNRLVSKKTELTDKLAGLKVEYQGKYITALKKARLHKSAASNAGQADKIEAVREPLKKQLEAERVELDRELANIEKQLRKINP